VRKPLALAVYAGLARLLEPAAGAALRRRAARGKEEAGRLAERLGRAGVARPDGTLIWLHGVSVGESVSLLPLVAALADRRPDASLLVTSGTTTAAAVLARRLPPGVIHQYAPIDTPGAAKRFLDHWRPAAGLFVESELWPNLILAAKARGVRLALISARMTERSAAGWARAAGAARAVLGAFDLILPQDAATEHRLRRLGGATGPRLSLKRVGAPLAADPGELARLRAAGGARPVVLAASTHPGEEALIAAAVQASGKDPLLVVAPRHPERGPEVAAVLAQMGFVVARRAEGEALTPQVTAYVADTLGELGLFFRLSDVTVMGGGFADGVGGHNPLEPARLGCAIVTGPAVFNAAELYDELFAEGAAIRAADSAALARHIAGLIEHPTIAARCGEAALAYAERQGRALDEAIPLIEALVA
jgi:3-deoxy-D-manno-octulosonic-acid transferase